MYGAGYDGAFGGGEGAGFGEGEGDDGEVSVRADGTSRGRVPGALRMDVFDGTCPLVLPSSDTLLEASLETNLEWPLQIESFHMVAKHWMYGQHLDWDALYYPRKGTGLKRHSPKLRYAIHLQAVLYDWLDGDETNKYSTLCLLDKQSVLNRPLHTR